MPYNMTMDEWNALTFEEKMRIERETMLKDINHLFDEILKEKGITERRNKMMKDMSDIRYKVTDHYLY